MSQLTWHCLFLGPIGLYCSADIFPVVAVKIDPRAPGFKET